MKILTMHLPGDGEEHECVLHELLGAARPRHTLVGNAERTARWTLATIWAGHIKLDTLGEDVYHIGTPSGQPVTKLHTLHYSN